MLASGYLAMDVFELEQFWVRGMPVIVGERPPDLDPEYGISNGRRGHFHSFGFNGPEAEGGAWRAHPRHFNGGDVVNVPAPDYINVKFLLDEAKGPNRDEWSVVVPFRAKFSRGPMEVSPPPFSIDAAP